jgi:hypothetical protein
MSGNADLRQRSSLPEFLLQKNRLVLYQSLGVRTGGSIALELLHREIAMLGFNISYCHDLNKESPECLSRSVDSVMHNHRLVVTGEWCAGVLSEYGVSHHGRGLQYHLGFHHHSGRCRGHVAIADSQFLAAQLGPRSLSAFYVSFLFMCRTSKNFPLIKLNFHIIIVAWLSNGGCISRRVSARDYGISASVYYL